MVLMSFLLLTYHVMFFLPMVPAPGEAANSDLSSFVGQELSKSDRPELASAKAVVAGGNNNFCSIRFHLFFNVREFISNFFVVYFGFIIDMK